jgi:GDPmannose 4,6-dehydratase
MSQRVAIITGITGQDGYYLTKLLLDKEYTVVGLVRRCSLSNNTDRIAPFLKHKNLILHNGDLSDSASLRSMIHLANSLNPRCLEIYNLAAQSHVQRSFEMPEYTLQIDAGGVLNLLEAIRSSPLKNKTRFYQASTSELYGKVVETPQKETTPFYPRSPYGVAKLYGFWITKNYRESYEMFAVNGILFNHESPMRGEDFVTRKITKGVVAIQKKQQTHISIGNLDAKRDWGHAKDYVEAMWRMLQTDVPRDWVVATGALHSVREFLEIAFTYIGKKLQWEGTGLNEIGRCVDTGQILVKVDPAFFRPAEVELLLGDSTDIREMLGWSPTFTFSELVKDMMVAEMAN